MVSRVAAADTEVAGCPIPAGRRSACSPGRRTATRTRWDDAERVAARAGRCSTTSRSAPASTSASGMHLARLELRVGLDTILDRLPNLRLDPDADLDEAVIEGYAFRGPRSLPVLFDASVRRRERISAGRSRPAAPRRATFEVVGPPVLLVDESARDRILFGVFDDAAVAGKRVRADLDRAARAGDEVAHPIAALAPAREQVDRVAPRVAAANQISMRCGRTTHSPGRRHVAERQLGQRVMEHAQGPHTNPVVEAHFAMIAESPGTVASRSNRR